MLNSFAKSFVQKHLLSRTQKKTFAGSHVGTLAAFVMDNLYMATWTFRSAIICICKHALPPGRPSILDQTKNRHPSYRSIHLGLPISPPHFR